MRLVCFSTGNFWIKGKQKDFNKCISICKNLDIDGVELNLLRINDLEACNLSEENIEYLKTLKHNTVHAPVLDKESQKFIYCNDDKTKQMFNRIIEIAESINAKAIVVHSYSIKDFSLFEDFNYKFAVENSRSHHNIPVEDYVKIIAQNPRFGFVLDTAHAIESEQIKSLVNTLKDRISFIHLSGQDHKPLYKLSDAELEGLRVVKQLECPVLIETHIGTDDFEILRKEIEFVREWVNA